MHGDCLELDNMFEAEIELMGKYYCDSCKKKERKSRNFPNITEKYEEQLLLRSRTAKNNQKSKRKKNKKDRSRVGLNNTEEMLKKEQ